MPSVGSIVSQPFALAAIAFIVYLLSVSIYRLYFHPLREFPGPKLAALTLWYEFYYDVVQRGQYVFKIGQMHEKYGPIIRINPYEIHVSTPDFFNEIYSGSSKRRDKWDWAMKGFGIDYSVLSTIPHDLHRSRRSVLNPLFSKAKIRHMQPVIQERVDAMLERMRCFRKTGHVINLKLGYAAFTADVAMDYSFGRSQDKVNAIDFDGSFHDAITSGFNQSMLMNQFPWILDTMKAIATAIPRWMLLKLHGKSSFVKAQKDIAIQVREALSRPEVAKENSSYPTIFEHILDSKLPAEEKSFTRLVQEGGLIVGAATVSTAWALTVATFCLVSQPSTLEKLKAELSSTFPVAGQDMDLPTLEHLPYLAAVIQEALRVSIGASHRSQRISPVDGVTFVDPATEQQWRIPPGTPMSMSHVLLFQDPTIFPDPKSFKPERWIENPGLEKYQFAFSKGTRQCLGLNLAMAELNLMLASIFRIYGSAGFSGEGDIGRLELFDTDVSDIECVGDGGVPFIKKDTKGVRFRIV